MLITALCAFMLGCASTKTIERQPAQETQETQETQEELEVPESETKGYPEQVAGTISQIYGEDEEKEQSAAYHDAVAENPLLEYIIIYFDFNQVEIKPESYDVLIQHATYLSESRSVEVSLEGHADKRGSSGYNLALGERRALAVKNFLLAKGVRGFQMTTISYGEERLAAEGSSEEEHARNRRVEIIYK